MTETARRPLWSIDDLIEASEGVFDGIETSDVFGFSIDTRTLETGDAFVALSDVRDGHDFVAQAFAKGAAVALVRHRYERKTADGALIRVDDPLAALVRIGWAARGRLAETARVIAVTGSAGKTTTKEMLRVCLERVAPGCIHASIKSYNNHWGVPLTLARMPSDSRFAVIEIGMNHAGEITPLTEMVWPHVALVTNVLAVHVGNFENGIEGVAHAKAEIFSGLQIGGTAILPADNDWAETLRDAADAVGAQIRPFGAGPTAVARKVESRPNNDPASGGQDVVSEIDGHRLTYRIGIAGEHIHDNALAVVLALKAVDCDIEAAVAGLAELTPGPGRGARFVLKIGGETAVILDESYNANPSSIAAALKVMGDLDGSLVKRRIAVLGDMLELGRHSGDAHRGLAAALDEAKTDLLFACGLEMKHLFDAIPLEKQAAWAPTSAELEPKLLEAVRGGDVIMIKGSLGSRMQPLTAALKARYAEAR